MTEMNPNETELFVNLGPNEIWTTLEQYGVRLDGHITALNSYENRVYRIGVEDGQPIVVKFYRPQRWSDGAILEELEFTSELAKGDIPVVAPLPGEDGRLLYYHDNYRFSIYPSCGGRPPEIDNLEHLKIIGRQFARIHLYGEQQLYQARPTLNILEEVSLARDYLLDAGFLPRELETSYQSLIDDILWRMENRIKDAGSYQTIRLQGDAHPGNILWFEDKPLILDFDDALNGPAIYDLWMFLSGDRDYMSKTLAAVLEGYTEFRAFDPRQLHLIETLRTVRIVKFTAWIAKRWHDPAFPQAFPYFADARYWEEHILSLREQSANLDEPALVWYPD